MTETEKVLLETKDTIATITLNRPERRNALAMDSWLELEKVATSIQNDPEVRVAIMTGAGDKAFSAGIDLKEVASFAQSVGESGGSGHGRLQRMRDIFSMFEALHVPVIAAINGYCIGAGMELALTCDVRLASEKALLSIPEVKFGIVPDMGSTQRLPRVIGPGLAKELILTGRRIDAAEALRIGLVDHIYPHDKLMAEARQLASEIAANSPAAVQGAKRAMNVAITTGMAHGLEFETTTALLVLGGGGGTAFREGATDTVKKR